MSYYKVQMIWFDSVEGSLTDPVEVFDPEDKDMCLINPTVTLDVGEAGSFDFVVPKNHVFYDKFMPYASVAVFEESTCIFVGRLRPPSIDMFGQKTFHAEGALAYLNDVILPPMEMENPITAANYIDQVLDYYDQYASARPDREIYHNMSVTDLANIQIYDPQAWNYQSALDILRSYVFKFCGGYFYVEFDGFDDIELKWRKYLTDPSSQVIQIGVNMLDLTRNGNEIYTAAIASGGQNAEGETAAMLAPVYDAGKVTKYGFVCKYLSYPDTTVVDALEAYCESFLENMQYDGFTFQASAADQHPINSATGKFLLGQVVNLRADSLGVDARLPITRIVVNLNSAIKDVTVGTPERNSIVVSTAKAQIQQEETEKEMECCSEDKQDKEINGYVIDIDDEGNISTIKVPQSIDFTKKITAFKVGDTFNYSDYEVTAYYSDGTSEVVTSSCTFNIADGYVFQQHANPRVLIATYAHSSGKKLSKQLLLRVVSFPVGTQTEIKSIATIEETIYYGLLCFGGEYAEHAGEIIQYYEEHVRNTAKVSRMINSYNDYPSNIWIVATKRYDSDTQSYYYTVSVSPSAFIGLEVGDTIPKQVRRVTWQNGSFVYKNVTVDSADVCGVDRSWYPEDADRSFYVGSCNINVE